TTQVHLLVEELQAAGIDSIMATEYFKPHSHVARLEFLCEDTVVAKLKSTIHSVGTTGGPPPDHDVIVSEHDPDRVRLLPMTIRLDPLEESRLKEFINNTFRNVRKRLILTFSIVALVILCVALILHIRIERVQHAAWEANNNGRVITDATKQIQAAHLEQMLAAERLHRGDMTPAREQFRHAAIQLEEGMQVLKKSHLFGQSIIGSLDVLESRFQSIMNEMFEVITNLDRIGKKSDAAEMVHLSRRHDDIMAKLDTLHWQSMEMLVSLERSVSDVTTRRETESDEALGGVRLSLVVLTAVTFLAIIVMWFVARQKVSHPLQVLVEEANALDMEKP
ncbi:MAG: hypothetical protein ABI623_08030, partial [bacterium]